MNPASSERLCRTPRSGASHSWSTGTCAHLPAVHCDGPILPELLLGLVHLPNEVNETLSCLWHSLLRPVCELELADGP